jgi:hypothetical protein
VARDAKEWHRFRAPVEITPLLKEEVFDGTSQFTALSAVLNNTKQTNSGAQLLYPYVRYLPSAAKSVEPLAAGFLSNKNVESERQLAREEALLLITASPPPSSPAAPPPEQRARAALQPHGPCSSGASASPRATGHYARTARFKSAWLPAAIARSSPA